MEEEEGRAAWEPSQRAAARGQQEHKGYKIILQESEGNANKKVSTYSIK